jgi:hypothetical protein
MAGNELQVRDKADVLAMNEIELYERLMRVIDRNPVLDYRAEEHNVDFCLIRRNVEITRNFALKAVKLGSYGYEVVRRDYVTTGTVIHVAVDVKVWAAGDPGRWITESGGCSTAEVEAKAKKDRKGTPERAFHDALGIAITRALKRGLEGLVGLPFINIMIKEIFGAFEARRERNVTGQGRGEEPREEPQESAEEKARRLGNAVYAEIRKAVEAGRITKPKANELWNDTITMIDDPVALEKRLGEVRSEIERASGNGR